MLRKLFFPCLVLLLLACCSIKSKSPAKIDFVISETYKQEEILPLLAQADFLSDSLNAAAFVKSQNILTDNVSDTSNIDINGYLKVVRMNALFKRFEPNITTFAKEAPFKKSSILGFSQNADTAAVSAILTHSGLFKKDIVFEWVPCQNPFWGPYTDEGNKSYSALVALKPSTHIITLETKDVAEVKIQQTGASRFWKFMDKLRGTDEYALSITFKEDSIARIKSIFPDDTPLLVRYRNRDREIYYSATPDEMAAGAIIGNEFRRKDL